MIKMHNFSQIVVLIFMNEVLSALIWKALKHYISQIP